MPSSTSSSSIMSHTRSRFERLEQKLKLSFITSVAPASPSNAAAAAPISIGSQPQQLNDASTPNNANAHFLSNISRGRMGSANVSGNTTPAMPKTMSYHALFTSQTPTTSSISTLTPTGSSPSITANASSLPPPPPPQPPAQSSMLASSSVFYNAPAVPPPAPPPPPPPPPQVTHKASASCLVDYYCSLFESSNVSTYAIQNWKPLNRFLLYSYNTWFRLTSWPTSIW